MISTSFLLSLYRQADQFIRIPRSTLELRASSPSMLIISPDESVSVLE